jgi:hypothetical protein
VTEWAVRGERVTVSTEVTVSLALTCRCVVTCNSDTGSRVLLARGARGREH